MCFKRYIVDKTFKTIIWIWSPCFIQEETVKIQIYRHSKHSSWQYLENPEDANWQFKKHRAVQATYA